MGDIADMAAEDEYLNGPYGTYAPDISPELNFVRAHPFTVQRGGIKYPKSAEAQRRESKETHMPEPRMTKAQVANELRLNAELQETLRQRRLELQRQARQAIPTEPPSIFTMFSVDVRFKMRGKRYQFLILRLGGVYFTTGGKPEHSQFASWEKLCEWLEGPEVYDHSPVQILQGSGKAVFFDSGKIQAVQTQQPPF